MKLRRREKKFVRRVSLIALILILLILFFYLMGQWEKRTGTVGEVSSFRQISYKGNQYKPKDNIESFLLIGLDKFYDEQRYDEIGNYQQSDFILVLVLDKFDRTYSALQLNRDTMVNIDILGKNSEKIDEVYQQLALAHTYGKGEQDSCRNTRRAVSKLLNNVKIDHYASTTLDSVAEVTDLMGGVEVEIKDDFSAVDPSLKMGETVNLNGEQAITFVRSRGNMKDSSNINRMERQRRYMNSVIEKAEKLFRSYPDLPVEIITRIYKYITSDLNASQVSLLVEDMNDYTFGGIYTIDGRLVKGEKYMEFYPSEDSLMETVLKLFYEPLEQ